MIPLQGMSRLLGQCYESIGICIGICSGRVTQHKPGVAAMPSAAASSSGVCSAVSCGQVISKDVLYSDE